MATVIKEYFPIDDVQDARHLSLVQDQGVPILQESAFGGFGPDDDFEDVVLKCKAAAQKVRDIKLGKLAASIEDQEMLWLNSQSMMARSGDWLKDTGLDAEVGVIDPWSNFIEYGKEVLKLVD